MSEIPHPNHLELGFDATELISATIELDEDTTLSLDLLFRGTSEQRDLSKGVQITDAISDTLTIDGVVDEDCRVIYVKDDCAVLEYNQEVNAGSGKIALVVVRQDAVEIVRPIPLITQSPVAGYVDAHDIIDKFRAADDALRQTQTIMDNA